MGKPVVKEEKNGERGRKKGRRKATRVRRKKSRAEESLAENRKPDQSQTAGVESNGSHRSKGEIRGSSSGAVDSIPGSIRESLDRRIASQETPSQESRDHGDQETVPGAGEHPANASSESGILPSGGESSTPCNEGIPPDGSSAGIRKKEQGPVRQGPEKALLVCTYSTEEICDKLVLLAETMAEIKLFPYQIPFMKRVYISILECEGEEITALFSRQCLAEGSVIFRRDGTACRIEDYEGAWSTGKQKCYEISAGQHTLLATANHPFRTEKGFTRLEDLKRGDKVAVLESLSGPRKRTVFSGKFDCFDKHGHTKTFSGKVRLTKDRCALLGYLTADGYCFNAVKKGQSIKFTSVSSLYLDEVTRIVQAEFPDVQIKKYKKGKGYDLLFTSRNRQPDGNSLRFFIRCLRTDCGFPLDIFSFPRSYQKHFLNRFWAADGYISIHSTSGGRESGELGLCCGNNETYARYCQSLLLLFGIPSRLKRERMQKNRDGKLFRRLIVSGDANCEKFFKSIGLIFGKEESCKRVLKQIDDFLKKYKRGGKGNSRRCSRPHALIGEDGEHLCWARVRSIRSVGVRPTYDAYFPKKGWFISQGFCVHNSGKSTAVACLCASAMVMLPKLAEMFLDDQRFNRKIRHLYVGFKEGAKFGVYAPKQDQSNLLYNKIRTILMTETSSMILREAGLIFTTSNGDTCQLSNGSYVVSRSASEKAHVEGASYHVAILDETQDIGDEKIRQGIHPMVAAVSGTLVKIGTPGIRKREFYKAIRRNKQLAVAGGAKNHFEYDYVECQKHSPFYAKYIEKEKRRLGENSDEFKRSYRIMWLTERGMFIADESFEKCGLAGDAWKEFEKNGYDERYGYVFGSKKAGVHVAGIDLGRIRDSTVVTILEVDWEHPVEMFKGVSVESTVEYESYKTHVLGWLELFGDNYEKQFTKIVEYLKQFNVVKLSIDSTKESLLADRLAGMLQNVVVEPVTFTMQWKSNAFKSLSADMEGRRLTYPANEGCDETAEWRRFRQQMLDLEKDYVGECMLCEAPNEPDAHDDYCFPAGTPIKTVDGDVPIEKVETNSLVWTRVGLRRVLVSSQTRTVDSLIKVTTENGYILEGTPNHPVFVDGRGFVRLDTLSIHDTVEISTERVPSVAPFRVANISVVYRKTPVYNLAVEGCHEYFAGGFLVHNCCSLALARFASREPANVRVSSLKENMFLKG